jgi:hypothetical protein|nr:hypothetical protein [Kofleriaceae bacterium]
MDDQPAPDEPEPAVGDDPRVRALAAERALWRHERLAGAATVRRGALLIVSLPLVFLLTIATIGALGSLIPIVFGLAYMLVGFVLGFTRVAAGTARSRRAGKRLRGLSPDAQLPAARVLKGRMKPAARNV